MTLAREHRSYSTTAERTRTVLRLRSCSTRRMPREHHTFNGTTSFVGTAAAFSATTTRNITLSPSSTLQTVNGNLTLSANQQAIPTTGSFAGILIDFQHFVAPRAAVGSPVRDSFSQRDEAACTTDDQDGLLIRGNVAGGTGNVSLTGPAAFRRAIVRSGSRLTQLLRQSYRRPAAT